MPDWMASGSGVVMLFVAVCVPALLRAWDIGGILARAIEAASAADPQVSRKAVAMAMGLSEAGLSRAIQGIGPEHLSADRLTRLPALVWVHLYLGIGVQLGFVKPAEDRARRDAQRSARVARAQLAHAHDNAEGHGCRTSCGGSSAGSRSQSAAPLPA